MSALPPDADKPRVVATYSGMNVQDCREHVRVVLTGTAPRGIRWALKDAGFKPMAGSETTFTRPASTGAIFRAQAIGKTFFPPQENS